MAPDGPRLSPLTRDDCGRNPLQSVVALHSLKPSAWTWAAADRGPTDGVSAAPPLLRAFVHVNVGALCLQRMRRSVRASCSQEYNTSVAKQLVVMSATGVVRRAL